MALIKLMRENRWTIVLSGFLLVIGTMNVLLIRQNLKLRFVGFHYTDDGSRFE